MAHLYLVRHGQASLLSDDYDQLSPLGVEQGRSVGRWLRHTGVRVDHAWSGGLRRHQQTAQACFEVMGAAAPALQIDPRFDEYTHHDLFARSGPEVTDPARMAAMLRASEHPRRVFHALFEQALDDWVNGRGLQPGQLRWAAFRERCTAALWQVAQACGKGQTAVVFSSGGAISAMCQSLMGVPDAQAPLLHSALHNASITKLLVQPGRISLGSFNETGHLQAPGEPPGLVTYR